MRTIRKGSERVLLRCSVSRHTPRRMAGWCTCFSKRIWLDHLTLRFSLSLSLFLSCLPENAFYPVVSSAAPPIYLDQNSMRRSRSIVLAEARERLHEKLGFPVHRLGFWIDEPGHFFPAKSRFSTRQRNGRVARAVSNVSFVSWFESSCFKHPFLDPSWFSRSRRMCNECLRIRSILLQYMYYSVGVRPCRIYKRMTLYREKYIVGFYNEFLSWFEYRVAEEESTAPANCDDYIPS